ncbi:MAG: Hsp70 family protein [Desulfobacterales bacterium]|nr:Hsp70 family protein [Desulfobacterales bacterium]
MGDIIAYDPIENKNVVLRTIQVLAEKSGITTVQNFFLGFVYFLENQADFSVKKQLDIAETHRNFKKITSSLGLCSDRKSCNSYKFCRRIYQLESSEKKIIFMSMVVSVFQRNAIEAIQRFSQMEEKLVLGSQPSYALGLKTAGDTFKEIIPANRKIPCEAKRIFTTNVDNITSIDIEIFQGMGRIIKNDTHSQIGTISISDMPYKHARKLDIEVNFKVEENQILSVTVVAEGQTISETFQL